MKKENHPVGFRKYVVLALFGYRLRLHVWSDGHGNDSRHNHRWWFVSVPIIGRFIETRYRETDGESYLKIDVHDKHGVRDGDRRYVAKGKSELEEIARKVRWPLIPYFCPANDIHSLVPHRVGLHISVVFCGRLESDTSEIWRRPNNIDVQLDTGDAREL